MDSSSEPEDFNLLTKKNDAAHSGAEVGGDHKSNKMEILRSRVDEQGKLICFLKRRADDQMFANKELSSRFEDLAMSKEDADSDIKMLRDHCEMLENRFDELAENHDEMIKIKDEYKTRCKELTKRNKQLEEENSDLFSNKLNTKDTEIGILKTDLDASKEKFDKLLAEHEEMETKFNLSKESMTAENQRLYQEMCQARVKLDKVEETLANLSKTQKSTLSKESEKYAALLKEKEDLLKEVMNRGRLIQDKQSVIETLQSRLTEQEREMIKLKEDFSHKEHNFSVNKRVNALMKEKDEVIESYNALKIQYKGLRDHSNMLLAKEKELNMLLSCGRRNSGNMRRNKSDVSVCHRQEHKLESD